MWFSKSQRYGLTGEKWVLSQLTSRGYQAALLSNFFADVDIVVGGLLRVEVKTAKPKLHQARPGYWRRRWQFNLTNLPDASKEDYVVVCVADIGEGFYPFVIPSALLYPMGRHHLQITSHPETFSGWAAAYLDRWQVVSQLLERRRRQSVQMFLPFGGLPFTYQEAS